MIRIARPVIAALAFALVSPWPAAADSREAQEAAFMRSVNPQNTANVVTGDLSHNVGMHVAYVCEVETIVKPGVILGQCGPDFEPVDLFVRLSTAGLHTGDRLRILGIMDTPSSNTDISGHTAYYAFIRAVFVDHLKRDEQ
jgi:hypothetical protein